MKVIGVTRIEGPEGRGSGWMVRLTRRGKTIHKWFADGLHGGKLRAARAAREYRLQLEEESPPPMPIEGRKTVRNTSGKVGVRLENKVNTTRRQAYEYQNYVAFWTEPSGAAATVTFSCGKYGKRAAFRMASIARDHKTTDRSWIERRAARASARN